MLSVKCRGLEELKGRRRRPENLVYRAGARLFLSAGARLFRSTNPPGGWGGGPSEIKNISFVFKNLKNLSPMLYGSANNVILIESCHEIHSESNLEMLTL